MSVGCSLKEKAVSTAHPTDSLDETRLSGRLIPDDSDPVERERGVSLLESARFRTVHNAHLGRSISVEAPAERSWSISETS
jgi:hypothetical protein